MAFTHSCYVTNNNENLIKKLEEIGYTCNFISSKNPIIVVCDHEKSQCSFVTMADFIWIKGNRKDYFYCSDDEELFLLTAAMSDSTDKNQLFVTEVDQSWVNQGMYIPKGSFEICLVDDRYIGQNKEFCSSVVPARKATFQEICKYCQNKKK